MTDIKCSKCRGKVFYEDDAEDVGHELFCILCGKRDFIHRGHPMYGTVRRYLESKET